VFSIVIGFACWWVGLPACSLGSGRSGAFRADHGVRLMLDLLKPQSGPALYLPQFRQGKTWRRGAEVLPFLGVALLVLLFIKLVPCLGALAACSSAWQRRSIGVTAPRAIV
jgi:hypothetical protein